jgi:hypothetical protein
MLSLELAGNPSQRSQLNTGPRKRCLVAFEAPLDGAECAVTTVAARLGSHRWEAKCAPVFIAVLEIPSRYGRGSQHQLAVTVTAWHW